MWFYEITFILFLIVILIDISLMIRDVEHSHVPIGHLHACFGRISVQVFCLFFNQVF